MVPPEILVPVFPSEEDTLSEFLHGISGRKTVFRIPKRGDGVRLLKMASDNASEALMRRIMRIAADGGRATRPDIHLGICGEHGGDPSSIEFCNSLGFTYVSCSPFRVPIARLAAAQAAVKQRK